MVEDASADKPENGKGKNRSGDLFSVWARIPDIEACYIPRNQVIGSRGGRAWAIKQCRDFGASKQLLFNRINLGLSTWIPLCDSIHSDPPSHADSGGPDPRRVHFPGVRPAALRRMSRSSRSFETSFSSWRIRSESFAVGLSHARLKCGHVCPCRICLSNNAARHG